MSTKMQRTVEVVESGAAYAVAGASITAPAWLVDANTYGELVLLFLGILIAATTLYLNVRKIRKDK